MRHDSSKAQAGSCERGSPTCAGPTPLVSLGLPVWNGARFLSEAIESVLAQTWVDFELIISDNASTDATPEICAAYAAADRRIRHVRQTHNLGAAPNFNHTVGLARGKYFKWVAHDDLLEPGYIQACVERMERDAGLVLCSTRVRLIGPEGEDLGERDSWLPWRAESSDPSHRFASFCDQGHWCLDVFGLIRLEALRRTPCIASFIGSDRALLAELSLLGRVDRVPEALFLSREHPHRSITAMSLHQRGSWFDTSRMDRFIFPHWRAALEYLRIIARVPLPLDERLRCAVALARWTPRHAVLLLRDLTRNGALAFSLAPTESRAQEELPRG